MIATGFRHSKHVHAGIVVVVRKVSLMLSSVGNPIRRASVGPTSQLNTKALAPHPLQRVTAQPVDQVRFGSEPKKDDESFLTRIGNSIKKAWHWFLDFFTPTSKAAIEKKLKKLDAEMASHLEKTNKQIEANAKKVDALAKKEAAGQAISQAELKEVKSSLYKQVLEANKVTVSKQKKILKLMEKMDRLYGFDVIQKVGLYFVQQASKEMHLYIDPKVLEDKIEQKYREVVAHEKQKSRPK